MSDDGAGLSSCLICPARSLLRDGCVWRAASSVRQRVAPQHLVENKDSRFFRFDLLPKGTSAAPNGPTVLLSVAVQGFFFSFQVKCHKFSRLLRGLSFQVCLPQLPQVFIRLKVLNLPLNPQEPETLRQARLAQLASRSSTSAKLASRSSTPSTGAVQGQVPCNNTRQL